MKLNVYNFDFRDYVPVWPKYKMIFADPPDNIGLKYDGYSDRMPDFKYRELLFDTLQCINQCEILWVSFNPNHMNLMGSLLHDCKFVSLETDIEVRWFIQHVTFGYNMPKDFSRCFRPMVRIMQKGAVTYPDAIRIESEWQKMGDKRADPRGKVPPDVWAIHRVTGNSKQRRKWHNTQLGEALYERCLDFSCVPGDRVADIFAGTGTMARAAEHKGLEVDLFDISTFYCQKICEEFGVPMTIKTSIG